jgi:hypothetical protein
MLKSAIIEMPETGVCNLDIEKVKKLFDENCLIIRWYNEYRLHQFNENERILKANISKEDALRIITELDLEESKSELFQNGSTFRISSME